MKSKLYALIIILSSINQPDIFSQNLSVLDSKNGFRDIKLGTKISNYPDFIKFDRIDTSSAVMMEFDYIYVGNEFNEIGNTEISFVFANTIDGLIYQIYVVTEKTSEIITLLKSAYGPPNWSETDYLVWFTDNVRCVLSGYSGAYWEIIYEHRELNSKQADRKKNNNTKKALKQF